MTGKLLNIIKTLTLVQKRDLKYFIQLPSNKITNTDKVVFGKLLELKSATIEKNGEAIWETILNKEDLPDKNRIKNRLLKAIERYISLNALESNTAIKYYLLADYYSEKQVSKNEKTILKSGIAELEKSNFFEDKIFLFWLYQLSVQKEKDVRIHDSKIDLMYEALNDFYLCNKIRIICEKVNRHKIINVEKDFGQDCKEIEVLIEKSNAPEVQIYASLFRFMIEGDEPHFVALDRLLEESNAYFKTKHENEVYVYLLNYCIRQINAGNFKYAYKYLSYIKKLEARGALLEHNTLGIGRFKNSILCSIIIGETEWASRFIDKYSACLSKSSKIDKEAFLILNKAIIEFYNDNIDTAFDLIREFQNSSVYNKDLYYRITCDKLLLKVFYELNENEAVGRKIDSIKTYLRTQKKLNEGRIQKHLNFLKALRQLMDRGHFDRTLKRDLLIPDFIWLEKIVKRNDP